MRQPGAVVEQPSPHFANAGYAPYLDYRPLTDAERVQLQPLLDSGSGVPESPEDAAVAYAVEQIVPRHLQEVKQRKEELVTKTLAAVKDRLTKEITYWDHRAQDLRAQELAGKTPRLNSARARERADGLQARLQKRLDELEQERRLSPLPPVVIGGALIVPAGLLAQLGGDTPARPGTVARETARIERLAMEAVFAHERSLGFAPRDVSQEKCGYDVESRVPGTGKLRFIEVKGRAAGATTVTVTKNEILTGLNKPEEFILAIVEVDGEAATAPVYLRKPFGNEPDFGVTAVTYVIDKLIHRPEAVS